MRQHGLIKLLIILILYTISLYIIIIIYNKFTEYLNNIKFKATKLIIVNRGRDLFKLLTEFCIFYLLN